MLSKLVCICGVLPNSLRKSTFRNYDFGALVYANFRVRSSWNATAPSIGMAFLSVRFWQAITSRGQMENGDQALLSSARIPMRFGNLPKDL